MGKGVEISKQSIESSIFDAAMKQSRMIESASFSAPILHIRQESKHLFL